MSFEAVYDLPGYAERPGVAPLGKIRCYPTSVSEASDTVNNYIRQNWRSLARSPRGKLEYPYLVPGSVYDNLWDWDGYFIAAGAPAEAREYIIGTALNLTDTPLLDGKPVKMSSPDGDLSYGPHPYPLRAQFLRLCVNRFDCREIVTRQRVEKICRTLEFYEQNTTDGDGFFCWQTMPGIDNNPSVYGRNPGETCGADLMSFHYREYLACAELQEMCGVGDPEENRCKAEKIKTLLNRCNRSRKDGFYYDLHRPSAPVIHKQMLNWVNRIPYRGCSGVFPLWAGVADRGMIAEVWKIFSDPEEFMTPWGIRSLSKREEMYNNAPGANPSNWQGPVWSLPNVLLVYALNDAGMKDEAADLAGRIISLLASDIMSNGCMHEYYDAENGEPVLKPGFISWHMLTFELMENLERDFSPFVL